MFSNNLEYLEYYDNEINDYIGISQKNYHLESLFALHKKNDI